MQRRIAAGLAAGALVIAGGTAALVIPSIAAAADPSASPAASTSPSASPSTGGTNGTTGTTGDHRGHGGPGGLDADDLTAAAKTLGMTEADLTTALQGGQTVAQVAKTKNVDIQKVIDAIVASDKAEIAAAVKAGTMTQAQADQRLANLTAHVTDEVDGVAGGPGGHQPPASGGTDGSSGTSGGGSTGSVG